MELCPATTCQPLKTFAAQTRFFFFAALATDSQLLPRAQACQTRAQLLPYTHTRKYTTLLIHAPLFKCGNSRCWKAHLFGAKAKSESPWSQVSNALHNTLRSPHNDMVVSECSSPWLSGNFSYARFLICSRLADSLVGCLALALTVAFVCAVCGAQQD